jgi:TPR repeat protein
MHYYGLGGLLSNKRNAALYYQMAAEMRHTHAMFNLGFMHEAGDGVDQDFHLAKRFYDQVAEFDKEAALPSLLAVSFLQVPVPPHSSLSLAAGRSINCSNQPSGKSQLIASASCS